MLRCNRLGFVDVGSQFVGHEHRTKTSNHHLQASTINP